jgi:uncharacterized protein (TIGR00661 family)
MKNKKLKILYAIQGTGNGHVTRAMEIVPILWKKGDVDVLISGIQADIPLPFPVKYKFKGMSFIFGKKGGIDVWNTYLKMNSLRFLREVSSFPIHEYDLVISDFEPISSWAALLAKKPSVGLSNQIATLHPLAPKPKHVDLLGKLILERYAPTTFNYGYHFKSLDKTVYTPIIRKEVREMKISDKGHYTVYLPSYEDERIIKHLKQFKDVQWQIFSKHNFKKFSQKNLTVQPLDKDQFLKSMASSSGVLCNAGFGTTSEALFMNKKLLVIPMKMQHEQQCNAAMLKDMGVTVVKKLKKKHADKISDWLSGNHRVKVNYTDETEKILDTIIENHAGNTVDTQIEQLRYSVFQ